MVARSIRPRIDAKRAGVKQAALHGTAARRRGMDLLHQCRTLLHGCAKKSLAREHGSFDEGLALAGEDRFALAYLDPAQQSRSVYQRQQFVYVEKELAGQAVQVHPASPLGDDLEETRKCADAGVRQRCWDGRGHRPPGSLGNFWPCEELV
jgi:hypothetical protein